jgi:hypothetical protein
MDINWKKVSEALPPDDRRVLVVDSGVICIATHDESGFSDISRGPLFAVTHWAPLPELPPPL